jgi:hypothetical protein
MTDRARMERLVLALEEARRVEKELDLRDIQEDDRRSDEISVRFARDEALAES